MIRVQCRSQHRCNQCWAHHGARRGFQKWIPVLHTACGDNLGDSQSTPLMDEAAGQGRRRQCGPRVVTGPWALPAPPALEGPKRRSRRQQNCRGKEEIRP